MHSIVGNKFLSCFRFSEDVIFNRYSIILSKNKYIQAINVNYSKNTPNFGSAIPFKVLAVLFWTKMEFIVKRLV